MMSKDEIQAVIDANSTACYRTLCKLVDGSALALDMIGLARPKCGYRCDGDEGPHPVNGSPGCFYSGQVEG